MRVFDPTAEYAEIREGVGKVCAAFPGSYWRELDAKRAYPKEFVDALIREGYLAAMIPEEFGGSGLNLVFSNQFTEVLHTLSIVTLTLPYTITMSIHSLVYCI